MAFKDTIIRDSECVFQKKKKNKSKVIILNENQTDYNMHDATCKTFVNSSSKHTHKYTYTGLCISVQLYCTCNVYWCILFLHAQSTFQQVSTPTC